VEFTSKTSYHALLVMVVNFTKQNIAIKEIT